MKKRRSELDEAFDHFAKAPPIGKSRRRELDETLSGYADVLGSHGLDSAQERAYLEKYANDAEALALLRGARAVKGLFEAFGQFPSDLFPATSVRRREKRSKSGR